MSVGIVGASLLVAVWGYYWDVSWHIDRGRDPGAFANPSHWFIILGLDGIAFGGLLALILGDDRSTSAVRLTRNWAVPVRSEEHTSELQSLMRISYAVFCLT